MLGSLRGSAAPVESTRNKGDGVRIASPTRNSQPNRLNANPSDALVDLSDKASLAVLAAYRVPPDLMWGQGQDTAAREAFRRFLHSTVTPLVSAMAAKAAHNVDTPMLAFDTTGAYTRRTY